MTMVDVVRDSLNYSLLSKTKIFILGIFYTILYLISFYIVFTLSQAIYHFDYKNLAISTNVTDFNTAYNLIFSYTSTNTWMIISLLSIFSLIILIFLLGYNLRIISCGVNRETSIPGFNNPLSIMVGGVKLLIISSIYFFIPLIFFSLSIFQGSLFSTIGFILTIIFGLIFIMAVNNMVANDNKISYAFKFREIMDLISEVYWIRYVGGLFIVLSFDIVMALFVSMVLGIIVSSIILLTRQVSLFFIYLILLSLFIQPFLSIFTSYFFGSLYNQTPLDEFEDEDDFEDDFDYKVYNL